MLRLALALVLCLAALSCAAAPRSSSPRQEVQWFHRGIYVGASGGIATSTADAGDLERDVDDIWPGSTVESYDDDDFAWKVFTGYRFDQPFAIEAGWIEMGEITSEISTTAPDVDQFLADVEEVHPFFGAGPFLGARWYVIDADRFHLGVGGGIWWWNAEVEVEASTGEKMDPDDDAFDPWFGINATWDISNRWSVRADYERYWLDDFEADVFTAGLQFRIL